MIESQMEKDLNEVIAQDQAYFEKNWWKEDLIEASNKGSIIQYIDERDRHCLIHEIAYIDSRMF